jgi:hypothetical protein
MFQMPKTVWRILLVQTFSRNQGRIKECTTIGVEKQTTDLDMGYQDASRLSALRIFFTYGKLANSMKSYFLQCGVRLFEKFFRLFRKAKAKKQKQKHTTPRARREHNKKATSRITNNKQAREE